MIKHMIATVSFLGVIAMSNPIHARDLLYSCPDINNTAKQTLGQIYQGYDGWFFKDIDFKQNYTLSPDTLSYMNRFNQALAAQDITMIFAPLMSKALIGYSKVTPEDVEKLDYHYDEIAKSYIDFVTQLQNTGIKIPDLLGSIQKYDEDDLENIIFKIDHHWTPEGAHDTAKVIAQYLKNDPKYERLPKIELDFKKLPTQINVESSMNEEVRRLCEDLVPAEKINIYDFEKITENNADALFGGTDDPAPIALIGTSFSSVNNFKFREFIELETGLETVNYSIPGGELYISMISYLSSDFFTDEKPEFLIWESPSKYNYNDSPAPYFRQMIPSIYGECSGDKIIAQTNVDFKGEKQQSIFKNLDDKKLTGNQYYLYILSSNPVFNKFTLDMNYDDGDGEWFNMDRGGRYKNNGTFYIELSDDIETHLSNISLENIDNIPTQLNVKICTK